MLDPVAFCEAMLRRYEQEWSVASGHSLRHPLRLKMEAVRNWRDTPCDPEGLEERLVRAQDSDDLGMALASAELLPLWRTRVTGSLSGTEKP